MIQSPIPTLSPEYRQIPPQIRQSYIEAVTAITPSDDQESEEIRQAIEWLRTSSALNKPDNPKQHLGVLSIVLSPGRDRTFLLDHKKARLWLPPGGHVDFGRTLADTASDELREELGVTSPMALNPLPIFLSRTLTQGANAGHIDLTTWFVFEVDPACKFNLQEKEASSGAWFMIRELLSDPRHLSLHRGFNKLLSHLS